MESLAGKRILFVITKSNWGGAQSYVFTLAQHCHAQGADVAVALGGTGRPGSETGMLAARLAESGIRTLSIPSLVRDVSFFREWRVLKELRELIREERPDVLHLNSSKVGSIGAVAGRLEKLARIVFTAHGWPHREPRNAFMKAFIWISSWATVLLSHAVIAVSEKDYATTPSLFSKKKVHLVHNGIREFPLKSREEARSFLAPSLPDLAKYKEWIFMPAELTRNKGIDIAMRAFAGVRTNVDSAALVIAGEGEEHGALARLIDSYGMQKRAFLLGFVPDVHLYLAAADIFLMASRKEGLPLALLEAGYAGLPVIATKVGGIPEVIQHEKNGLLIEPDDVDGLADALTRLLLNPEEAQKYGKELKCSVREKFSEEEMLKKTLALY